MPFSIISPGFHVGMCLLDVNSGRDGVSVLVSDASHEICHTWYAWAPWVKRRVDLVPFDSVNIIDASR